MAAVRFVALTRPYPCGLFSFRLRLRRDRCPGRRIAARRARWCRSSLVIVGLRRAPRPASTTSIRTSTGRAVCGSVISTTIATARSPLVPLDAGDPVPGGQFHHHGVLAHQEAHRCAQLAGARRHAQRDRHVTSPPAGRWWPPTRATRPDPVRCAPECPSAPRRCAGHTTAAPGESSAAVSRRTRRAFRCTGTNRQRGGRPFPRIPGRAVAGRSAALRAP